MLKLNIKERIGVLVQYILLDTALQSQDDTTLLGTRARRKRTIPLQKIYHGKPMGRTGQIRHDGSGCALNKGDSL